MFGHLRKTKCTVRCLEANDLIPRRKHKVFLFGLNNARTQASHDAMARIETQFTKPLWLRGDVRLFGLYPRLPRMRAAIQWRADQWWSGVHRVRLLVCPVEFRRKS